MGIKAIIKSLTKIFLNSKKSIHFSIFTVSAIIICLLFVLDISLPNNDSQMSILTGISILSSFFLLTLQNVKYDYLNENFQSEKKISKNKYNKESVIIRNTIFSIAIMSFSLTGICFILNIFSVNYIYVLIWLIIYLFFGIIYTVILWNYIASKQMLRNGAKNNDD